jgi:hypothetical protein
VREENFTALEEWGSSPVMFPYRTAPHQCCQVAKCSAIQTTQKGPNKKVSGRTNQWPNWRQIYTQRAEKGANFETAMLPLLFPNE